VPWIASATPPDAHDTIHHDTIQRIAPPLKGYITPEMRKSARGRRRDHLEQAISRLTAGIFATR
jgi:hypothetical protein